MNLKFGDVYKVILLRRIPVEESWPQSRHWPYPKAKKFFDPGDMVFLKHRHRIALFPFEMAGSGFELVMDPVEGIDFKFQSKNSWNPWRD